MITSKFLIILHLVMIWTQIAEFKELNNNLKSSAINVATTYYAVDKLDNNLRGIKDLWIKIKNRAIEAWDYVKHVAKDTKEKIFIWTQNVKRRAKDITKAFEERLKKVKDNIKATISNIIGTNEEVKQCLNERNLVIEDFIKQILKNMTICFSNNILKLSSVENIEVKITINDTSFYETLEIMLNTCEKNRNDIEDIEKCLYKAKANILDEMIYIERDVLKNWSVSRSVTDDILDAIISCSVNGFIEASSCIMKEAAHIIICILKQ